jgi:hypothetical protein
MKPAVEACVKCMKKNILNPKNLGALKYAHFVQRCVVACRFDVRSCKAIAPTLPQVVSKQISQAAALDDCVKSRIAKYVSEPCKNDCQNELDSAPTKESGINDFVFPQIHLGARYKYGNFL